jgi:hypothetical protein
VIFPNISQPVSILLFRTTTLGVPQLLPMKRIAFLICSLLSSGVAAQHHLADTAFQTIAVNEAKKVSFAANASQSGLYNGVAFVEPPQTSYEQFPYYTTNDWLTGAVHYDGVLYENVALMYDIVSDYLITEISQNGTPIRLINEKIDYFVLNDLVFVKMDQTDLGKGFFARLYNGPTKVLVRYEKKKQEKIEDRALNIEYESKTRYYILKNEKYFSIRSKADLLKVLGDQKSELKQFIKQEHLRFTKKKEISLTKVARFYDNIPQ